MNCFWIWFQLMQRKGQYFRLLRRNNELKINNFLTNIWRDNWRFSIWRRKSTLLMFFLKNFLDFHRKFCIFEFFPRFFTCVRGLEGQGLAHQMDWIQKSSLFQTVLHKLQSIKGHHRVKVAVDTNYKQKYKNQWLFQNFHFIKNPKICWDKRIFWLGAFSSVKTRLGQEIKTNKRF